MCTNLEDTSGELQLTVLHVRRTNLLRSEAKKIIYNDALLPQFPHVDHHRSLPVSSPQSSTKTSRPSSFASTINRANLPSLSISSDSQGLCPTLSVSAQRAGSFLPRGRRRSNRRGSRVNPLGKVHCVANPCPRVGLRGVGDGAEAGGRR